MAAQPIRSIESPNVVGIARTTPVTIQRELPFRQGKQAYRILQVGFTVAPLIAGADKFFHLLTNWDQYLAPMVPSMLGISANTFMRGVGIIEIIAGIGVALKPRIFAYVVSAWLAGIVINLLVSRQFLDIALRDVGLSLGALALGRLSSIYDRKPREIR